MNVAAHVQKHCEMLRRDHCRRLDVWIGGDIVARAHQVAKATGRPLWSIVEDALEVATNAHTAAIGRQT